ncbi:MAG TPA: aminoglycoside phosphotransferase family protein [Actinomycetota bacterium]|nr:aminoglycoside phosphotransferase family protein [Actinomycetota bacterium]
MKKTTPELDEVEQFLTSRHRQGISDLEMLHGGFWSAAYGYRVDGRGLVLRIGQNREWFDIERDAMTYHAPDLPVPEVIEIGDGLGGAYAISVRHYGRFLETIAPHEADNAGRTIVRLLAALKGVPPRATPPQWCDSLRGALIDDYPERHDHGWRDKLAAYPDHDALFRACEARIVNLIASCPERADLIHGDLLSANVLVNDDASHVTAVFSWKCSRRGDFLYDTALCTFMGGAFYPGIAGADVYRRVLRDPQITAESGVIDDAASRHHCYELHIGATHLGGNAWLGNEEGLRAVATHTQAILDRGPLMADDP